MYDGTVFTQPAILRVVVQQLGPSRGRAGTELPAFSATAPDCKEVLLRSKLSD